MKNSNYLNSILLKQLLKLPVYHHVERNGDKSTATVTRSHNYKMQHKHQIQEIEDTAPSEPLVVWAPLQPWAVIGKNDNFTSMNCLSISKEWMNCEKDPLPGNWYEDITARKIYSIFGTQNQGQKGINYSTSMFFWPDMNGQLSWWSLKDFSSFGSDRQNLYARHKQSNSQILKSSWVWLLELVHKCRFLILVLSLCQNIILESRQHKIKNNLFLPACTTLNLKHDGSKRVPWDFLIFLAYISPQCNNLSSQNFTNTIDSRSQFSTSFNFLENQKLSEQLLTSLNKQMQYL